MTESTEKTEAELAAEKAAAAARKAEEKAAAKAAREAAKAEEKAAKEAAKAEEKAAKEAEKAAAKAAKQKEKMPESNGVRRPKPETLCGQAWAIFDEVSAKNGSPASIKECLEIAKARNLNEGNVRVEYARWRKFYGITGRIPAPGTEKTEGEGSAE